MAGILDIFDSPDLLGQIIGINPAQAMTPPPRQPQAPPPPPQNVMGQAPPSFAPNSSFDGGGLSQPAFNARFSPGPGPEPSGPSFADRAAPAQEAIADGSFDPQGRNSTTFAPTAFAGAPQTRNGFPSEVPGPQPQQDGSQVPGPPAPQTNTITVSRTPRDMRSLDQVGVDQGTPPLNINPRGSSIPSSVVPGGLAASLGYQQPQEKMTMGRAVANAMAGLGKGLSAVGQMKPGSFGAANFAAGAGGALEGAHASEQHNQERDLKAREYDATNALRGATLAENQRYHTGRLEAEKERNLARMAGGAGAGGRDFQFDHKYNAWLAVHKDDHEGALDYANGHKKMRGERAYKPPEPPKSRGAGGIGSDAVAGGPTVAQPQPPATKPAAAAPKPPSAAPMPQRPPNVPAAAGYSATTGKWYVRGPDGKPQEVAQ